MQTMISVLLPTRKRRAMVERSLTSLLKNAGRPQDIEICIAYDDDDEESKNYFNHRDWQDFLSQFGSSSQVHECPRWGYFELQNYVNHLAKHSQGKWLLFWGDDVLMETENWDDHVRRDPDWVGLLHFHCVNSPMNCSIQPLFHRAWLDLFGQVCPTNHSDSWISDVCWNARARKAIPVNIFHDRPENSGNNRDETWEEKKKAVGTTEIYHRPEYKEMRRQWTQKLVDYRASL
jgi:glycosyltransferase involved in cell wall biosynthesis